MLPHTMMASLELEVVLSLWEELIVNYTEFLLQISDQILKSIIDFFME